MDEFDSLGSGWRRLRGRGSSSTCGQLSTKSIPFTLCLAVQPDLPFFLSFPQRQMGLSVVVISLMSCLLNLLSTHYLDQPYGLAILKTLFLPQWYQRLNTHLHGSHSESILVTMKLYTAMSNFAGGRERKVVMEVFAWDNKVAKLLNMRRRGRGEMKGNLSRPGECYCQLSCHGDPTTGV